MDIDLNSYLLNLEKEMQFHLDKVQELIIHINFIESKMNNKNLEVTALLDKNPAAVALGRLGGLTGGLARARNLSPQRRKEIATNAALARWNSGKV
jgi:hypothetical protein